MKSLHTIDYKSGMSGVFIDEQTGFAQGEMFTSPEQVRAYFTVENMTAMFGSHHEATPEVMDEMAEAVLREGWHMEQEPPV